MSPHIEDLKDALLKLLTIEEYSRYELLVTLLSFMTPMGPVDPGNADRPFAEPLLRADDSR